MQVHHLSWEAKAKTKVADMESKIPSKWVLEREDLDQAKKQRDLTGPFIEQFLTDSEKTIVQNDSVSLVEKIKRQQYSAVEVAQAFCKTAAISQQIVSAQYVMIRSRSRPLLKRIITWPSLEQLSS